ncbi:MAG: TonB-dependent receptor [Saprospiraceae bacterium]|nr:TonB-dependent receptor [Saprospiraceae bacterium]
MNFTHKIFYLTLLLIFCGYLRASAQQKLWLNGIVVDAEQNPLLGANALILNPTDSVMETFVSVDENGVFKVTLPKGKTFLLQISFLGYQTHEQEIQLDENLDLGTIVLKENVNLLDAVEVEEDRIPIQIKGDTIEYNADAFGTREQDDVEDLLKKLPGVEVDRDGTLKAQGEEVDKILVDGKEFFGSSTEIAMKNLPANAVDKVQVYDRKSELSEFSGVEDGIRKKTINLKLKKDKKHGFFGNLAAGYGYPEHRYQGKLNVNYFNSKMRLSGIGAINNINEQSFSFRNYLDLMGGIEALTSKKGGSITLELEDGNPMFALLRGNQQGIAKTIGGGLNFNLFASEKTEFSSHYFYSIMDKNRNQSNFSRSLVPGTFFQQLGKTNDRVRAGNHNLNSILKHKFDANQDLKVQLNLKYNQGQTERLTNTESSTVDNVIQNRTNQDYTSEHWGIGLSSGITYRKRLKKKGRSFITQLGLAYNVNDQDNLNFTRIAYPIFDDFLDTIHQIQANVKKQQIYTQKISWVEPLSKKSFLELRLNSSFSIENRAQMTDEILTDDTRVLNPNLSNVFLKRYDYQQFTTRFQHVHKKRVLSFSGSFQRSYLAGSFDGETPIQRNYYYPLLGASLDWKLNKASSFYLSYDGEIREPQITQLQPVPDNSNPTVLQLGNPNLVPTYQHNLQLKYNLFDMFSFTNMFANIRLRVFQNEIVNTQTIDEFLNSIYQPQNIPLAYELWANVNYGTALKPLGVKFNIGLSSNLRYSKTYINSTENNTSNQSYTLKFDVENRKKKHFDLVAGMRICLKRNQFSISKSLNNQFVNYEPYVVGKVFLGKKKMWTLESEFEYGIYVNAAFSDNLYIPMLSSAIYKSFLDGKLQVGFSASNLLDQQQVINRFGQDGQISEFQSDRLGRYFMLSVKYKFRKMTGKDKSVEK